MPRALLKEILRNSFETVRRRAIQNNLAGVQLKWRVDALDKGIQLKWRVGARCVQMMRNSIETAHRRAIQRSVEEFNCKTARGINSIETPRRRTISKEAIETVELEAAFSKDFN